MSSSRLELALDRLPSRGGRRSATSSRRELEARAAAPRNVAEALKCRPIAEDADDLGGNLPAVDIARREDRGQ